MTTLTIDDETAQALHFQATSRGVPVEEYVRALALSGDRLPPSRPKLSKEEFATVLRELAAGSEHIPPLPADFSRADIYDDHD